MRIWHLHQALGDEVDPEARRKVCDSFVPSTIEHLILVEDRRCLQVDRSVDEEDGDCTIVADQVKR